MHQTPETDRDKQRQIWSWWHRSLAGWKCCSSAKPPLSAGRNGFQTGTCNAGVSAKAMHWKGSSCSKRWCSSGLYSSEISSTPSASKNHERRAPVNLFAAVVAKKSEKEQSHAIQPRKHKKTNSNQMKHLFSSPGTVAPPGGPFLRHFWDDLRPNSVGKRFPTPRTSATAPQNLPEFTVSS